MRITATMLTAVAVLLLPVTLFTVPHAREQAAPGSDADSSAFRFLEAIRVMAPSVALPNWQRQTNLWRKATNPARGQSD